MHLQSQQGHIEDLTIRDKNMQIDCRIGNQKIKIHPDLVSSVTNGDKVFVAGESRKDVLYALAVYNIKREKVAHVDSTNYILGIGLAGYISVMAAAFGLAASDHPTLLESTEDLVAVIGFAFIAFIIRKLIHINWSAKRVGHPDNQAEPAN